LRRKCESPNSLGDCLSDFQYGKVILGGIVQQRRIRRILWLILAALGVLILVLLPKIWGDLVYPLRYQDEILAAAEEFNLEPTFICGVIFTESHFNPQATSRVGARGLMQIMPATAAGIARQLGVTDFNADQLYDPAINIRFGSYYLRNLFDRYGEKDVVLAAYNGGPGVANRYAASRQAPIPKETAGFIIKVKNAEAKYLGLYGAKIGFVPPEPEPPRSDLESQLKQAEQEPTFWDRIFGWVFNK
jgi:soluble lytic murein transglycosylase